MDKKSYIEKNLKNLSLIRNVDSSDSQVEYLCPLCMKPISIDGSQSDLTEEDVPQASLGGQRITLTCKNVIAHAVQSLIFICLMQ